MRRLLEYARDLFDAVPVGIVAYDVSGECVSANRAAVRILGRSFEQILTQNFRKDEGWAASGLLGRAEETISTGQGRHVRAYLPTAGRRRSSLDCRFESFVSGGRHYLLYLIDDTSIARCRLGCELDDGYD
ncbi:MAG TPA: PAS domain-containing protein [Rectinemataceae bacterium]|nr:PAS domain-containing protein [Rectinemataceae bacterium]